MRALVLAAAVGAGASGLAWPCQAQQKRIYIANDDHTDYYWSADGNTYRQAFLTMIDYYLNQADQTAANPPDYQGRFNCDGSFWLWEYEHNRTPAQFQRLIDRMLDGHISAPMTPLVVLYGGAPVEGVLRGMYYAGRLERRYPPLRFRLAISMEDQAMPWGLASLWAGSGARYSWKGICNCVTNIPSAGDREHDIYWYTGPDGQRILMKWNTLTGSNEGIGGYAEARDIPGAINYVNTNPTFLARFPFPVIGIFGRGWDDLQTLTGEFITRAQTLSNAQQRIIVSNEQDFFEDFQAHHSAGLPTVAYSYGNEWELYCASMAEVSASVKRSIEKLRAAEAMATLVSLENPAFLTGRAPARDQAFTDIGLYWEHHWTADGPVSRSARAAWQRSLAAGIRLYVDTLHADAAAALGGMIGAGGPPPQPQFFVFNPLGWARTDAADVPYTGPLPAHVVDWATSEEVPSQGVVVGGQTRLRILAANVPAVGYRVYQVLLGAGQAFPPAATTMIQSGVATLQNPIYSITIADRGAITGLTDLRTGRAFENQINARRINDLGSTGSAGVLTVENAGPVSVTIRADSPTTLQHTSRITLYRDMDRIDIENRITQNFSTSPTYAFTFNLQSPRVRHEEVGAIARAWRRDNGGDYATRQIRYDWLTLNHFADMTDGADAAGITLGNADAYYMRLGNSTIQSLDNFMPQISVLAGGQVDGANLGIPNQGGDTLLMQRFALRTHGAYDAVAAMKMSLEHQNPLVAGVVPGTQGPLPADVFSAVSVSDPNVLLWSLKPAEEGIERGVIARLWNVGETPRSTTIQLSPRSISAATAATHLETDEGDLPVTGAGVAVGFVRQQIRTVRLAWCYANCDGSTAPPALNVNDFICFQSRFAAGDLYANCDGSTSSPVLNVNDFICFQGRFAAGCP